MSTDEVAALQKELQTVKARAVGKIKALQAQVTELQAQVLAEKAKSPPEVSSSEDGSEKGFVKVGEPGAVLQRREAELDTREAALAAQEATLAQREEALALREKALASDERDATAPREQALLQLQREQALQSRERDVQRKLATWNDAVIGGLQLIHGNLSQINSACDGVGM
jgi:hypothetical protein